MPARAMYKAEQKVEDVTIPVKLYAAVEDRRVHFRLLHQEDGVPVQQRMVDPSTREPVPPDDVQRGYEAERGTYVLISQQEQEQLQPKPTRTMDVLRIVPQERLGHQWYVRPYYLGPDGDAEGYFALAQVLAPPPKKPEQAVEAIVSWVMRKKEYRGALRSHQGYLVLLALRHAGEVIQAEQLPTPGGRELDPKEQKMAAQLVEMLSGPFEPEAFQDEYRQRLGAFIQDKAGGGDVLLAAPQAKRSVAPSLAEALEASVKNEKRRKVA